jgi:hypothetical protein
VWWIVLGSLLALVVLLIVLDRVAVAYADNQAAQQMKSQGFPTKPNVSIQGFPFLTQVLSRNLNDIHITASNIQEGPVKLSLVGFSSLASAGGIAGAPGLSLKAAGPNAVKITVDLQVFTASALATITRTGPDTFKVHISSTNGIPASVLGSFRDFTVHIPALPMNLSIKSVTVSSQGVLIHVTGNNVKFTQNGLG